jgi:hypothetical protein
MDDYYDLLDSLGITQEELCGRCEDEIIEGCSNCSTFQCEGRFCDQALQIFIDEKE